MSSPSRKYPSDLLEKIRQGVNLVEIVGEHVVLRKSGANYTGLCPFHSERSPSFSVSETKQLFHCYGCKKGGDLFGFVMEIYGISFPEAIEELAERARVALPAGPDGPADADPEVEKRRKAARERVATAHKLNRFVAAFYHQNLKALPEAARYFRDRGVGEHWIRACYLGGAPAGWDGLARHLLERQAPRELAAELGLIRVSTHAAAANAPGAGYFDLFRNRVMFPILDTRGKVAGFGGRALGEDPPKYLNSPESFIFQKSKLVYGLYQAQKHIREKDEVLLVEGYFDVLALHAAGFPNAVASCGTSLTPEHLALFRRFASRVTILFDGDRAGLAATERAMEIGLEHGMVLNGATLPAGMDPDELLFDQATGNVLPGGKEQMEEILQMSKPLLDRRIDEAIQGSGQSAEAKTQAIKRVAGWLGRFTDPVGREVRVQLVQQKMGITRQLLQQAMGPVATPAPGAANSARGGSVGFGAPQGNAAARGGPGSRPLAMPEQGRANFSRPAAIRPQARVSNRKDAPQLGGADRILMVGLARGGEAVKYLANFGARLPPGATFADLFEYPPAYHWAREWEESRGILAPVQVTPDQLTQVDLDPQVRSTLTEALVSADSPFEFRDFQIVVNRAIGRIWARFSQRIKESLAAAEAKQDAELQKKLNEEFLDVQRKIEEFNRFYDEA